MLDKGWNLKNWAIVTKTMHRILPILKFRLIKKTNRVDTLREILKKIKIKETKVIKRKEKFWNSNLEAEVNEQEKRKETT